MTAHIVVLGAGFSGSALAVQLLARTRCAVTLVDASGVFGRGLAYSTRDPAHLLNVRAGRMSLFPDDPDHFVRSLKASGRPEGPDDFVPRMVYGDYVQAVLAEAEAAAPGRLTRVTGRAASVEAEAAPAVVRLEDGRELCGDAVVLATGNGPPAPLDLLGLSALGTGYVEDPWAPGALDGIAAGDDVVLVGAGLTMIDVVLSLAERGWTGRGTAISRHGLLPRPHRGSEAERPGDPPGGATLSQRLHAFRQAAARDGGWHTPMFRLRPHLQALWRGASEAEQRRFLRHLRPYWDVHRHRTAPQVGARIQGLIDAGRLEVAAGRLLAVESGAHGFALRWRRRGGGRAVARGRKLINCTGPRGDVTRSEDPVLRDLVARGRGRPDRHRLGLDVDERARVLDAEGRPQARLFAMGPPTRGTFWEIVAVPEIRGQAADLAETLGRLRRSAGVLEDVFLKHPREVGESYVEHAAVAGKVGAQLLWAGAACLIHAVLPAAFPKTASQTIIRLNEKVTRRDRCREKEGGAPLP
ncbi:MAG TPA: DUF6356 family protein [Caulobacteraceae bacterium]